MTTRSREALTLGEAFLRNHGPKVLIALVILIVGWIVAAWLARALVRHAERSTRMDRTLVSFLAPAVRGTLLLVTVIAVLDQLGMDTTSLLAVLGAGGLALGLALKDTVADVAAGVVLLTLRPFGVGEAVSIAGKGGVVDSLELFQTKLTSFDGVPVVLPNRQVRSAMIENYTRAKRRRFDVSVGVSYGDDLGEALTAVNAVVAAEQRVLTDPAPLIKVDTLGDSSVNLLVRLWTLPADFLETRLDLTRAIKERLDADGLSIPFPQRDVHLVTAAPDGSKAA